jgi:hypothetical protein
MQKYVLSFVAVSLLMAVSPARAIPVSGTFSGIVTFSAGTSGDYYYYPAGTPVTGTYEYTPALLNDGSTGFADPTASFQVDINGQDFGWSGDFLDLSVDANGMPVSGSGIGVWDLFLGIYGPGFVGMNASGIYSISAQVTYSTPSTTPPTVPDAASTSCLTGIAMLALAVFGRLSSRPRKDRPAAR